MEEQVLPFSQLLSPFATLKSQQQNSFQHCSKRKAFHTRVPQVKDKER